MEDILGGTLLLGVAILLACEAYTMSSDGLTNDEFRGIMSIVGGATFMTFGSIVAMLVWNFLRFP